ncbi:MAG TPA: J domain-containing protein [Bacteriovoracaceae bacterium]|nr:J domain-containing protein [Bacteriovoracaceae bacterium]
MDVTNYYITTLTKAFTKIGPIVGFIVIGYFIFVKLPFLFFLRNMKKSKESLQDQNPVKSDAKEPTYSVEDYEKFVQRKKRLEGEKSEPLKLAEAPKKKTEEKKKEEPKREEKKKEPPKDQPKKNTSSDPVAEALFEIKPGVAFTKEDLKKKYHELLKMNHPDKVAALSPDFKNLADKKTKEINSAYTRLLKRAA